MLNESSTREPEQLDVNLDFSRRGNVAYRQHFEALQKAVAYTESWIVSSMPRAGLQIVQPSHMADAVLKPYSKEFHAEDAASWAAITQQRVVRGVDVWGEGFEQSRYVVGFMQPIRLRYLAVAPLAAPVIEGYPGALHVYRTAEQGEFTDHDLRIIGETAAQMDQTAAASRKSRQHTDCTDEYAWAHRPTARQFVFNAALKSVLDDTVSVLDDRVRDQIASDARRRIENLNGVLVTSDRLAVPDSSGDLWTFRVVVYKRYPALGDGPFVFYCLQPESCDWRTLRASDVQADGELSRLVPALQFMQDEFHRGPTLNEIAKTVHLSPFHFHRRFTELLGITPKHFLLECQIFEAKQQLVSGNRDLVEIASSCGFAHQSHFTSRFKQATGLTPTRWRRLALKIQEGSNS